MRRGMIRWLAGVICVGVLGACSPSPSRVFQKMQQAARDGDRKAFVSHFSEKSRPFAEALLALYAAEYPKDGNRPDPLSQITLGEVRGQTVDGERAEVQVSVAGSSPRVLVFVREGRAWKLDVEETDRRNQGLPEE
ncbi:hypothetical protein KBD49_06085 [Myxococcota bacterium]|nr:hypothetical protein [Myxococcota bacterium]